MSVQQHNYQVIDYSDQIGEDRVFEESHVSLYSQFALSGSGCWADATSFELKNEAGKLITNLYLLKDTQPSERETEGEYITTFLTNGLKKGKYTVKWTFDYNSQEYYVSGDFELIETVREQYFIDQLKTMLGKNFGSNIPTRYLMFDPTTQKWSDGELFMALKMALSDINISYPILETQWTLGVVPCEALLLRGAEFYALMSIVNFEIAQKFSVGVPLNVDLYKGDKYDSMMRYMRDQFVKPLLDWKKNYALLNVIPVMISRLRIPYRILRPLSMTLHFSSLFPY